MPRAASNALRQTVLPLALLAGDTLVAFAGLALGWWLRYNSALGRLGLAVPGARFGHYLPLLLLGVALLIASYAHLGLYDPRMLLRRYQSLSVILRGAAFWFAAYLAVSLVLKFDPPISRLFVAIAFLCVLGLLYLWRLAFAAAVARPRLRARLQQGVALLGWNEQAQTIARELAAEPAHPFVLRGVILLPGDSAPPAGVRDLGPAAGLADLLAREPVDLLIATSQELPRDEITRLTAACERAYVEWKIIPSAFQLFLSGLRLQTVGRLPVLGVEALPITKLFNRALKRGLDLAAALAGLVLSAPVIAVLAVLIRRESPGPAIFRQPRVGAGHRPFVLLKLRSMALGAERHDDARQSTARGDPRLLRIGAFLRRWNLDELPQFWNVLKGDMSLVGPRPERPHHVEQLAGAIPHYLPRHLVKPGMTGWAQVNGLRGECDLVQRLRHDIYYIENWSVWLDVQILLLTFVRWKNPA